MLAINLHQGDEGDNVLFVVMGIAMTCFDHYQRHNIEDYKKLRKRDIAQHANGNDEREVGLIGN